MKQVKGGKIITVDDEWVTGADTLHAAGSRLAVSSYVLFLLLGLGSGAVYGILALGLVLKHRSAGVVDFGHGAVAMFIAYVYLGLRDDGTLQFPWVMLPHEIYARRRRSRRPRRSSSRSSTRRCSGSSCTG